MTSTQIIQIEKIGYDPQYYPRVNGKEDWLTVHRYTEVLKTHSWKADHLKPGSFPPVVVAKATGYDWPYILLDGLHRLRAFAGSDHTTIAAIVERIPQSKWMERSAELNIDSKRPLDSGDKRWVATKLRAGGWGDDKIASLLCMESHSFQKLMSTGIQKLTKASVKSITPGRSNRQIGDDHIGFLKTPFQETAGTGNAQKALHDQGSVSSRNVRQIVESFVAILAAKVIDMTDEELAGTLHEAKRMLDELMGEAENGIAA